MQKLTSYRKNLFKKQKGFSLPELIIVILIISIITVLALPQIISSRRLFRFAGMQREVVSLVREARQEAMTQRKPITFVYLDDRKEVRIYGGIYANFDDAKNKVFKFDNTGLLTDDIRYGRPGFTGAAALADGTNLTALDGGKVEITFQADGSVVDASDNPEDKAIFFFHLQHKRETPFAVSILGAGGRVKLWRYSQGVNTYVE